VLTANDLRLGVFLRYDLQCLQLNPDQGHFNEHRRPSGEYLMWASALTGRLLDLVPSALYLLRSQASSMATENP
jgi:hypothetical protein